MFLQDYYVPLPTTNTYDGISRNAHACTRLAMEYICAGQIFWANPNYHYGGPRYDWAVFQWAREGMNSKNQSKEYSCAHYRDET
jgi:hypothetical protein